MVRIVKAGPPPDPWSYAFTCKGCGAELEADGGDVRLGWWGGGYAEPGDSHFYAKCPACRHDTWVPDNLIPGRLAGEIARNRADKR